MSLPDLERWLWRYGFPSSAGSFSDAKIGRILIPAKKNSSLGAKPFIEGEIIFSPSLPARQKRKGRDPEIQKNRILFWQVFSFSILANLYFGKMPKSKN